MYVHFFIARTIHKDNTDVSFPAICKQNVVTETCMSELNKLVIITETSSCSSALA